VEQDQKLRKAGNQIDKYTIKGFQTELRDDAGWLEWLKEYRWPGGIYCEKCGQITTHHLMTTRRSFS
jgi:hypothetical protein